MKQFFSSDFQATHSITTQSKAKLGKAILTLVFAMALSSCNKEGFYEKEYLADPSASTETTAGADNGGQDGGVDAGVDGSTQGGVSSGVTGGTDGSATTGSATGGTTDGTTTSGVTTGGSTTGGTDGSVTGTTTSGSTTTTGGTDGSVTTGSTTGGATTGGTDGSVTTGGATTGATTTTGGTDGTVTTGSTTGGATTGSTAGGATTGDTTGGTTTGGATTGSTVGGTTGGTTGTPVTENFSQAAAQTKKLDVLWIVDDSGSMAGEQDSLGRNFDSFISDFITKDVDFKMAITTTDVSSGTKKGKMVTGSDTKLTSAKAQADQAQFMLDFKNLVKVGTAGSGYEKGLEASEGFMAKHAASWMRPDAYLAVVILSDEEDQSPMTPMQYWDNLKGYKSSAGLVKVYTIVDVTNSNPEANVTIGHERYAALATASAGIIGDIQQDFAPILADMGEAIINLLDSFALANEPLAGSLKVFVNNVETTNYTYDAASRSIKFPSGQLPPVGATIKVTYLK